ncbi:hypothetical protein L1887_62130 [Cichorium endivia]|nr:hypothetical protein L1887_62130 [Cichorium endivia]
MAPGVQKGDGIGDAECDSRRKERCSEKTAVAQVDLDDNVVDRRHDKLDLGGVGGAGKVGVDGLGVALVEADESVDNVLARCIVVCATGVVAKVVGHGRDGELLLEEVDLVEEEDDGRLDEPARVADAIEQRERLLHAVDVFVFVEQLIVLGDGHEEDDGGDVFKAVDPLFALGALASDVEELVVELANLEVGLGDAGGLDARAQHVLVGGEVLGLGHAVDRVKVVLCRVVELVFAAAAEAGLDAGVLPEAMDGVGDVGGEHVGLDAGREAEDDFGARSVGGVCERDIESLHGVEHDAHGLYGVGEDDLLDGGLARLSCAEEQHLDLVLLGEAVLFELRLDGIVTRLPLLVDLGSAATHIGEYDGSGVMDEDADAMGQNKGAVKVSDASAVGGVDAPESKRGWWGGAGEVFGRVERMGREGERAGVIRGWRASGWSSEGEGALPTERAGKRDRATERQRERARPGRSGAVCGAVCGAVRDQAERGKRKRAIEQWRPGYRRFAAAFSSSRLMAGKKRRLQLQLQSRTHKGAAQTLQSSRAAHRPFAQKNRRTTHALDAHRRAEFQTGLAVEKTGPLLLPARGACALGTGKTLHAAV